MENNVAKGKFLIVDGNGLAYRSFYAIPVYKSSLGMPVNALCGFVKLLFNVIYSEAPSHVVVAFDHSAYTERLLKYQGYNVQRDEMPEELSMQLPIVEDFVHACGIRTCRLPGFEADDCIGTMVKRASKAGLRSLIISGDLELLQLVSPDVKVLTMRRGLGDMVVYNEATVKADFRLAPHQLADLRALAGDSGQNISGISGIGNVTACRLLSQYNSLNELYDNLDRLPTKWRNPLREHYNEAQEFLSRATIRTDLPLDLQIEDCEFKGLPVRLFGRIFELLGADFEFGTPMLDRLNNMAVEEPPATLPTKALNAEEGREALLRCAQGKGDVSVVWLVHEGVECGVAVATEGQPIFYLTCGDDEEHLSAGEIWKYLRPIFCDDSRYKYVYRSQDIFRRHELSGNKVFDVALASGLLCPEVWQHTFEDICARFGLATYDTYLLFGDGRVPWEELPEANKMWRTSCAAKVMSTLGPMLAQALRDHELWDLYWEIDIPLARSMSGLITSGMHFDPVAADTVRTIIQEKMVALRQRICEGAGYVFDVEDDKDLGEFLFAKLGLLVPTRPKAGEEISTEILDALEGQHPLVTEIRKYRELADFVKIFVQQLFIEGRLEFDVNGSLFNVALMSERRLQALNKVAMTGPALIAHRLEVVVGNILSSSMREPLYKAVKKAIIPSNEDHCIVALAFDQAPLRVLAHIAEDEELKSALREGNVVRQLITAILGVEEEHITPSHMHTMERMLLCYMGAQWLARRLTVSVEESSAILERFDTEMSHRFPTSWKFIHGQLEKARRQEYLNTVAGRKFRPIDVLSRTGGIRDTAEHRALGYAIGGSIADIERAILAKLYKEFHTEMFAIPIFEGLVMNVPRNNVEAIMKRICAICEECSFGIELPVCWNCGENLEEAAAGMV